MKNANRFVPILAGSIAATAGWGIASVGCGSSSSNSPPGDGGGTDSTSDVFQGGDVVSEDAGPGSEANAPPDADASAAVDGDAGLGPDTDSGASPDADASTVADADANTVADADASSIPDADAGGASDADSGVADSGTPLNAQTFPSFLAKAFCNTIAACCGSSADAAAFNWNSCYNNVLAGGFKGINTIGVNLVTRGNIAFNVAQAQTCLNTIGAADCSANQISSAEQALLYQSCYGAYSGMLTMGSPCAATIECAPGNFCMPVDGGVGDAGAIGTCQALAGVGGACGFLGGGQTLAQTVCSYRGTASNGVFCQNISGDAGTTQLYPAQWTCQPQWANGSDCFANQDCTSRLCVQVGTNNSFQCGPVGKWAYPNTCSVYVSPVDAGGGG